MNYLLVNHIAAHAGQDAAHLRLPLAWARDVMTAAKVARTLGIRLTLATPITTAAPTTDSMEVVPDEAGFEHIALPGYSSARSFLRERSRLEAKLRSASAAADIVQLDLGGHPIPLGLVADPIVRGLGKPTLWIVDRSTDLRPGSRSKHAAKRAVGRTVGGSIRRSLHEGLRAAGGVIATSDSTAAHLRHGPAPDAIVIESIAITDAEIPAASVIAARHARLLDTSRPLTLVAPGEQTVERGLNHVLAAMHRCGRLRAPVKLIACSRGSEVNAFLRHAKELGLSEAITLIDEPALEDADLVVDASLANSARLDLDAIIARGLPAIAYAPRNTSPGVTAVARGAVDAFAEAIFRGATDRPSVASLMLAGQAWARPLTLDAAHRRRFEFAREIVAKRGKRGAA